MKLFHLFKAFLRSCKYIALLLGPLLGFTPLPISILLAIATIVAAYIGTAEVAKRYFFEHN